MDILQALAAVEVAGDRRCLFAVIANEINDLPDDKPGKHELINRIESQPADTLSVVLSRLERPCGATTIKMHRKRKCGCYR